jgi:uncharacterized protein YndB with AHSA1/START domain
LFLGLPGSCSVDTRTEAEIRQAEAVAMSRRLVDEDWRLYSLTFSARPAGGYPIDFKSNGRLVTKNLALTNEWRFAVGGTLTLGSSAHETTLVLEYDSDADAFFDQPADRRAFHGGRVMPDIVHEFPIKAPLQQVFDAVSTPKGLDKWWTSISKGETVVGTEYELNFGPGYDWRGKVTACDPPFAFELEISRANTDWNGTRVGFRIASRDDLSWVHFEHTGWPDDNEHYRGSCYCWAMYLRIMKRHLEHGESVPYEKRLDA